MSSNKSQFRFSTAAARSLALACGAAAVGQRGWSLLAAVLAYFLWRWRRGCFGWRLCGVVAGLFPLEPREQ